MSARLPGVARASRTAGELAGENREPILRCRTEIARAQRGRASSIGQPAKDPRQGGRSATVSSRCEIMRRGALSALLLLMTLACGGSPTRPTPLGPPPVAPRARLVVVQDQELTFPNWPCAGGECPYAFDFRNEGPDCATRIAGTLKLFNADQTTQLAMDEWTIDPTKRVQPQETVRVEDGPLPFSVLSGLDGKFSVTFTFDTVRCS